MRIIITGVGGFIGFSVALKLIEDGHEILGLDNINDYYDVKLKYDRLKILGINSPQNTISVSELYSNFEFVKMDLVNFDSIYNLLKSFQPELVIHLAAQAGVRYSIQNPKAYFESNIIGYFNLLESLRMTGINKIIYASSSSVYGNSSEVPFVETSYTDHPVSFYAATKKCNELFSESYSKVHGIHAIGMRFFTVYGPFGRPDMAYFSFVKDILSERAIKLFNYGNLSRDFTYIDDIVNSVLILSNKIDIITKETNHQIFNIGNSSPVSLISFVNAIEDILGKKAIIENVGMQPGDVYQTFANVEKLKEITGLVPETTLVHGLTKYVSWYKSYYL